MAAPTVRADYDQLKQVVGAFRKSVEESVRTLQNIKSNKETLQGGDWIGQGATAFYREMDDSVLPTLQRLINALETAANSTAQISSIMKDAEDQAANVLKGSGTAAAGGATSAAVSGGSKGAGAPGGGAGAGAPTGGATGSAFAGGGGSATGASAPGASQPGPAITPPDTGSSVGTTLNELYDTGGMVAGLISALEAGGATAFAEGVVGTSIGSLLLPIGAFKLGLEIGLEDERQEALMDQFKMKLTGSATLDAVQSARAQMQAAGVTVKPLNEQGIAAVTEINARWRDQMQQDIYRQLHNPLLNFGPPEQIWQEHYDDWVKGMSKDLANVYANQLMTK